MIWLRSLAHVALSLTVMAAVGLGGLPLLLIDRRRAGAATRWFARFQIAALRVIAGIELDVRGLDTLPDRPVLIACKHQSALETYALTMLLPRACFVLKREIVQVPVAGWFIAAMDVIAVDRAGGAAALKSMVASARQAVGKGRSIVIFPEGTRTAPGERRRFHPGVAALYVGLDLPVVPVALNTGLYWRRRHILKHPGRAVITFMEPIAPGLDRKAFMAELQRRIEDGTDALVREARAA